MRQLLEAHRRPIVVSGWKRRLRTFVSLRGIGYSRVSTSDQDPSSRQDALERAGVDRTFVEHFTGTRASRPEWDRAREELRAGDTLVVTRLDRLGRSTKDLLEISRWLDANGVEYRTAAVLRRNIAWTLPFRPREHAGI